MWLSNVYTKKTTLCGFEVGGANLQVAYGDLHARLDGSNGSFGESKLFDSIVPISCSAPVRVAREEGKLAAAPLLDLPSRMLNSSSRLLAAARSIIPSSDDYISRKANHSACPIRGEPQPCLWGGLGGANYENVCVSTVSRERTIVAHGRVYSFSTGAIK